MSFSRKLFYTLIIIILFSYEYSFSQENGYKNDKYFTIISYNVENLFDTINNPQKEDDEFLPTSKKGWNTDRYEKKIKDLSLVIKSINKNELPEIVGLVEVENRKVVEDLVNSRHLKEGGYGIVHEESPDARGIDVALVYRKSEFKYLLHEKITVKFDFEPETTTRDILYVKGQLSNNEKLHVFVNHWSSRRDGMEASEPKRTHAATLLRMKVDSILKKEKDAKIVIIGDFNDEPVNKNLFEVLNATAKQPMPKNNSLYNLMYDKDLLGLGTYNFRGNWNMLDNIIVSTSLLDAKNGYRVSSDGGQIFSARWILYDNVKTGDFTPNRTYGGPNYYGGVSDHLPVFLILKR
jgi:predicted extracellular nuclease